MARGRAAPVPQGTCAKSLQAALGRTHMLRTLRNPSSTDSILAALLGGKSVLKTQPTSAFDWVEAIRAGLPAAVVTRS